MTDDPKLFAAFAAKREEIGAPLIPDKSAPWHIPGELRPSPEAERMSVDAKLELAKYTLAHLREWTAGVRVSNPETGRRINNRAKMEHLTSTIDNCLRAIQ